jgi:hypothetical protein
MGTISINRASDAEGRSDQSRAGSWRSKRGREGGGGMRQEKQRESEILYATIRQRGEERERFSVYGVYWISVIQI